MKPVVLLFFTVMVSWSYNYYLSAFRSTIIRNFVVEYRDIIKAFSDKIESVFTQFDNADYPFFDFIFLNKRPTLNYSSDQKI